MKNSTIGSLLAFVVIVLCIILGLAIEGRLKSNNKIADAKWKQFLECSKNEGDMGCDSCYVLVFGKHAENAGYLKY